MSVTNVLEEIMQLTGESAQPTVPGEDSASEALPANRLNMEAEPSGWT